MVRWTEGEGLVNLANEGGLYDIAGFIYFIKIIWSILSSFPSTAASTLMLLHTYMFEFDLTAWIVFVEFPTLSRYNLWKWMDLAQKEDGFAS